MVTSVVQAVMSHECGQVISGATIGWTPVVGVRRIVAGVDAHGEMKSLGVAGADGVSEVAPPALLVVGEFVGLGCAGGNNVHERLPDLYGSEHGVVSGVVDVGGAALCTVGDTALAFEGCRWLW